ncbi:unnamed protein product [Rotaria socialis]|uniref:Uncharacterized protein n=1 Tax=Rotaria socialis TaxID=392032 RepID=A0A818U6M3_9BILA|nr:unnamed protein product [Rotaria socialis]CAF4484332.1 unnamed protein product [Rotaria socialis]
MSRGTVQRRAALKKVIERDSSIGDRTSDDEANRRRLCYQLIQKEKQKNVLSRNDTQKINNQLDMLREILFNQHDINDLMKRSNRSDKPSAKNDILHNGKSHLTKKAKVLPTRNMHPSDIIDSNQSDEDNLSVHSVEEDVMENEPVRESRLIRKDIQQHPMARSSSLYSESRHRSNDGCGGGGGGVRTLNSVSFMSDRSKNEGKSNGTESHVNPSADKLKKLLDRLSLELNDLELRTGFKSNANVQSSHTCSTALATALITLTGHVKQCVPNSKRSQEVNHLKDQLSVVIKNQLDFQKKIENQMITLQTMMQTICQLINTEIAANKKCQDKFSLKKNFRDQTDFEGVESRQNWPNKEEKSDTNHTMNEILKLTRRMSNGEYHLLFLQGTPIDADLYQQYANSSIMNRHSAYFEASDASRKPPRPTSSMSASEINVHEISKQAQQHKNIDQESRSSMISPIEIPPSYDMFELGLANRNSLVNRSRNEIDGLGVGSTTVPSSSINETLLEKILHERLRLVQQMSDLSKQHEMTQEELANLEAKAIQT